MLEPSEGNELGYMPKDGWVEILQDICPLCGNPLPLPSDLDIQWMFVEPFCLFTGAYARMVCCVAVYLTWRKSDGLFHYEIKDDRYWRCKSDDRHQLNGQLELLRERARDNEDKARRNELSRLQSEGGNVRSELAPIENVQACGPSDSNVQDLADRSDEVLPTSRRMPIKYDF